MSTNYGDAFNTIAKDMPQGGFISQEHIQQQSNIMKPKNAYGAVGTREQLQSRDIFGSKPMDPLVKERQQNNQRYENNMNAILLGEHNQRMAFERSKDIVTKETAAPEYQHLYGPTDPSRVTYPVGGNNPISGISSFNNDSLNNIGKWSTIGQSPARPVKPTNITQTTAKPNILQTNIDSQAPYYKWLFDPTHYMDTGNLQNYNKQLGYM